MNAIDKIPQHEIIIPLVSISITDSVRGSSVELKGL